MTEREFALDVVRRLQDAGFQALWAGGCVRDELLGLTPADYDVATNARPDQLRPLFKRRNEIGASFGVVQVIGPRDDAGEWPTIEVATFRSDVSYTDGRRPDAVVFSSPEEDAKRRDFTINGMFFDPVKEQVIDYVGGRADLDGEDPSRDRRPRGPLHRGQAAHPPRRANCGAVRACHRPRDSRGRAAHGQRDSRRLVGADRRGVAEAPGSSQSCAGRSTPARVQPRGADLARTGRRWWQAMGRWRSGRGEAAERSVVSARIRGTPECVSTNSPSRKLPTACVSPVRRRAGLPGWSRCRIPWMMRRLCAEQAEDAARSTGHRGPPRAPSSRAVATGNEPRRGGVLRADASRHAAGDTEPAAGAHRRGPDRDGPQAWPRVQADPRRRPRGAAGGEGEDRRRRRSR